MFGWRTIRIIWSSRFCKSQRMYPVLDLELPQTTATTTYLEPLVLQDTLDGSILP